MTKDSIEVGEVSGAVMNDNWRITYLHLALNKNSCYKLRFIQPLRGHVTLCLPVNLIKEINEVLLMNLIL